MSVVAKQRPSRLNNGDSVLCDYDPKTGRVVKWDARPGIARVQLDPDEFTVERNHRCLIRKTSDGEKVTEFFVGYMLCKVHRYVLLGHEAHPRDGAIYVNTWHVTYSTGYQGRHTGGRVDRNIYCIVLGGQIVFRPAIFSQIAAVAPETVGNVAENMLCII